MTQTKMRLKSDQIKKYVPKFAEAVGLSSEDEVVTLRFIANPKWGQSAQQVRIDKNVAEQLIRMLNEELDSRPWAF